MGKQGKGDKLLYRLLSPIAAIFTYLIITAAIVLPIGSGLTCIGYLTIRALSDGGPKFTICFSFLCGIIVIAGLILIVAAAKYIVRHYIKREKIIEAEKMAKEKHG